MIVKKSIFFFNFPQEIFSPDLPANWLNPQNTAFHPTIVFIPCQSESTGTQDQNIARKNRTQRQ